MVKATRQVKSAEKPENAITLAHFENYAMEMMASLAGMAAEVGHGDLVAYLRTAARDVEDIAKARRKGERLN